MLLRTAFVGLALVVVLAGLTHAQTLLYVDAGSPNDGPGNDWEHAYHHLQDALTAAASGGYEIHVAAGTYLPGDTRTDTFQLIDGVAIRGGYRGLVGGGNPDDRGFESILSGDLGTEGSEIDNSYRVVMGSGTTKTAVLEGFTITAGNADGPTPYDQGAGMYNYAGSPTVSNCIFIGNQATFGGAVFNEYSHPTLINCVFSGNHATGSMAGLGGGMCNTTSSPTVTGCIFHGNSASGIVGYGGGMANSESDPILTNCVFRENSAPFGGGVYSAYLSDPTVTNCTFSGNIAAEGGAVWVEDTSPALTNCVFWGNTPDEIYNHLSACVVTYSCVQDDNPDDDDVHEGAGNIDDDPLLTGGGDLHLQPGSPCRDAGSNDALELPEADLDGHARILCSTVDMGAYEFGIGNHDCDDDVDLDDFAAWETCMTGPNQGPYEPGCAAFDFEFDGNVDLDDFAAFQRQFHGPP